MSTHS